jgi:hypothetical protein
MNIIINTQALDAKPLKETCLERLHFALRRLSKVVSLVRVRFSDANGPRGGLDKHCQVQLDLQSNGSVLVNAKADNWRSALEEAIRRVMHLLVKRIQQVNRPQRNVVKRMTELDAS